MIGGLSACGSVTVVSFPPSLRLRFTLPFAEPQAEVLGRKGNNAVFSI
jgi:hypothetical protein